ncbi:MAG: EAL and HDOD domain-containing protein [Actinomycetes bacterium]
MSYDLATPVVAAPVADMSDAATATPSPRSRVGRQGIYDRDGALVAHELLFRGTSDLSAELPVPGAATSGVGSSASAQDRATSQVIAATFGDFGLDELAGGRPVFLNMTRGFLVDELPLPFGPKGVVLEVLEHIEVDDELLAGLERLRSRGFSLALDDFVGEEWRLPLLGLVDYVKVDMRSLERDVPEIVELCRRMAPEARLVAEGIEDAGMLAACMEAGFDLFQGYFFQRPAVLETTRLSPSQMVCLRLLKTLNDSNASTADIERVVAADPGLSLRVLRTANSASTGAMRSIHSLRQAVVLLGPPALSAWVMLTLMGGLSTSRRDDLVTVLARAICCETIAEEVRVDPATAYTAGMLSGVAQVLRSDVGQVASGAGMDAEMQAALVDGAGPLGGIVRAVEAHELDEPDASERCGVSPFELSRAYLSAWANALAIVSKALDR